METPRDDQLAADLRALRPAPRPEFAAKLDERAAAGFPRHTHWRWTPFERLRLALPSPRALIPAGALAVVAIVAVSVVVAGGEPASEPNASGPSTGGTTLGDLHEFDSGSSGTVEEGAPTTGALPSSAAATAGSAEAGGSAELEPFSRKVAPQPHNRAVERSAELVLAAAPGDVGDDSAKVFEAVHAHDGIVMSSSTREGKPGEAAARFELLIPSAKLGDALAALSAIDEVRSRHEATDDITAPTVAAGELLADSKARIDSLLAQLEGAETESGREAVEAELAGERRHRARLRAQLQHLERRADYSRVLVRIETGGAEESSGGGAWGVGDALDDAGQILAVAAAVTVVALAILGPIALLALLAWLTHRAWVRRERRRVLS
ncbi:MAG TPA: DUF4349 domain-containing protein [Solirubrobacterales bacterium]|jgi:hypothetical protein|nr:DUF4349 domain-containing protein [Solirubrobacterales bacterium]